MSARLPARFWAKVDWWGNGCWLWTGCTGGGYGRFVFEGKVRQAHRVAYEAFIGPIPEGLQIDHLCRNRACVRVSHLEAVTQRENVLRGVGASAQHARQTHCIHGHEFTPENTFVQAEGQQKGRRRCRTCVLESNRRSKRRNAA